MLEGEGKKASYDLFWLRKDMENMGFMFEYCGEYAKEVFHETGSFDKLKFMNDFMQSKIRSVMEYGHPGLLSQAAIDTFEKYINVDCNGNIKQYTLKKGKEVSRFHQNQAYWVGYAYAFIHYHEDMWSKDLVRVLPVEYMLQQYITGHQMDISQFYERIKPVIQVNLGNLK